MTTIYIPQRIETAEQAEALPNGTIAVEPDTEADRFSLMRVTYDGLECWITDKKIYSIDFPVGWTALIPTTAAHHSEAAWDMGFAAGVNSDDVDAALHETREIDLNPYRIEHT